MWSHSACTMTTDFIELITRKSSKSRAYLAPGWTLLPPGLGLLGWHEEKSHFSVHRMLVTGPLMGIASLRRLGEFPWDHWKSAWAGFTAKVHTRDGLKLRKSSE